MATTMHSETLTILAEGDPIAPVPAMWRVLVSRLHDAERRHRISRDWDEFLFLGSRQKTMRHHLPHLRIH